MFLHILPQLNSTKALDAQLNSHDILQNTRKA